MIGQLKGIQKMIVEKRNVTDVLQQISAVKKALDEFQPDFLVNAHIHEASGMEEQFGKTRVINVSKKEKIFEI